MSSQAPNVGIRECELPHTHQLDRRVDEPHRLAGLVGELARRSTASLWPICHGPSISLPMHHTRTPYGLGVPVGRRRSAHSVPPGALQYSTSRRAASSPRVPMLTASIGSAPALRVQARNSSVPNWLVSIERHARSSRRGRASRGPIPSSQS